MDIFNYFVLLTGNALVDDQDFNFWDRLDGYFAEEKDVLMSLGRMQGDIDEHNQVLAKRRGMTYHQFIAAKGISEDVASLETRTVPEAMLDYLMENFPERTARLQMRELTARLLAKRAEAAKSGRKP